MITLIGKRNQQIAVSVLDWVEIELLIIYAAFTSERYCLNLLFKYFIRKSKDNFAEIGFKNHRVM